MLKIEGCQVTTGCPLGKLRNLMRDDWPVAAGLRQQRGLREVGRTMSFITSGVIRTPWMCPMTLPSPNTKSQRKFRKTAPRGAAIVRPEDSLRVNVMALYFAIEAIKGRSVSAGGRTVTVDLRASVTDVVRLNMSPSVAAKLVDTLTALNDEAMMKQAPPGMKAGAYRESEKVAVNLDATGSVLLIDFYCGKPHRVGVAVSIEKIQALVETLTRAAEIAGALRQIQIRQ